MFWGHTKLLHSMVFDILLRLSMIIVVVLRFFLLRTKSNTFVHIKDFLTKVTNQFRTSVKIVLSDNGSEFFNDLVRCLLLQHRILHHSICVGIPQQMVVLNVNTATF